MIALSMLGETKNIMTLGGLALAVGILVDDATVTIENIERHRENGHDDRGAILSGAAEIAVPAMVSTLCICLAAGCCGCSARRYSGSNSLARLIKCRGAGVPRMRFEIGRAHV